MVSKGFKYNFCSNIYDSYHKCPEHTHLYFSKHFLYKKNKYVAQTVFISKTLAKQPLDSIKMSITWLNVF